MKTDAQALIIMAVVGIVAGFLAHLIVGGSGNVVKYLISGLLGAFVGSYALGALGVNLGVSNALVSQILTSTIGAVIVLILARIVL